MIELGFINLLSEAQRVLFIVIVGVETVRVSCGASGTWDTSATRMEFQS